MSRTYCPTSGGRHDAHRLRQHDLTHPLPARQAGRERRLDLAGRHRTDAGCDDLADEAGGEVGQRDDAGGEGIELDPEFRQDEEDQENLHQERRPADQVDPGSDCSR